MLSLQFEYDTWAFGRLLGKIQELGPDEYTSRPVRRLRSLRALLVHVLDTEVSWRDICQKGAWEAEIKERSFPEFGPLRKRWETERATTELYVIGLSSAELEEQIRFQGSGERWRIRGRWQCLLHVANHNAQHRAEMAAILTELGRSPKDLDLMHYLARA